MKILQEQVPELDAEGVEEGPDLEDELGDDAAALDIHDMLAATPPGRSCPAPLPKRVRKNKLAGSDGPWTLDTA